MIAGRNSCHHYNDFTAGGQTDPDVGRLIVGDCQPSGSGATGVRPPLPLYVGPDFGQDGVRVTAGASIQVTGTTISSNLVHGANAPIGSVFAPTPNNDPFALGNHAENNQNLRLGAGVRLVGAAASSVTQSNVTDNAFGVLNTTLNGLANNTATPLVAQNDYWGLRVGSSSAPIPLPTPGPAVWPNTATPGSTFNPPIPENPVNGSPVADASCPAGVMDSDSVTFCPYRASTQSDTVGGEWPIPEAPIAQTDPPNCTTGSVQLDPNIPTYNSFFGTVLGGPNAGDGLSGATPSAKKTAQLSAYMQAVADAVNANPGTTGQRVAVKLYQSGTSVLGVPFHVIVVGTPDNIANLDAGRNDAAFWRGVIDGTTLADRRARRGRHAARLRLDHRHPARQRAGGRRGLDEGALRAGRAHRLRQLAAAPQPRRVHPAGHRAGRPRPQRPHAGVGSRPEPGPRRGWRCRRTRRC